MVDQQNYYFHKVTFDGCGMGMEVNGYVWCKYPRLTDWSVKKKGQVFKANRSRDKRVKRTVLQIHIKHAHKLYDAQICISERLRPRAQTFQMQVLSMPQINVVELCWCLSRDNKGDLTVVILPPRLRALKWSRH